MSYNAGDRVRVAHDNGPTVPATIVGHTVTAPTYRDACSRCTDSTLFRHELDPRTAQII